MRSDSSLDVGVVMVSVTGPVTVRHAAPRKAFAWSFSKLKNFEGCPLRMFEVDMNGNRGKVKKYDDATGNHHLIWGNEVHAAMAKRLSEKKPLPSTMVDYERYTKHVEDKPGELFVEQQYAITASFKPTAWFSQDAWYRAKGDVVKKIQHVAYIGDWKTGGIEPDSIQLALMASMVFSHFPDVHVVIAEYVWLKEFALTTEQFTRTDMVKLWPGVLRRVATLEHAVNTNTFPATPGKNCRWCPVTVCQYNPKRS